MWSKEYVKPHTKHENSPKNQAHVNIFINSTYPPLTFVAFAAPSVAPSFGPLIFARLGSNLKINNCLGFQLGNNFWIERATTETLLLIPLVCPIIQPPHLGFPTISVFGQPPPCPALCACSRTLKRMANSKRATPATIFIFSFLWLPLPANYLDGSSCTYCYVHRCAYGIRFPRKRHCSKTAVPGSRNICVFLRDRQHYRAEMKP